MAYVKQHEVVRVPQGWTEQDKALIVQLNRIFDDIYKRYGRLGMDDIGKGVKEILAELQEDKADKSDAIKNITRSGTTFTATRADGSTFTFTQQDNDHYAWNDITGKPSYYDADAIKNITRSGTTFTATKMDGSTFTFTQRDNDHYAWSDITGKPSYYDADAIKNITRSGTTFTATKMDGSTFTFTQRDNDTDKSTQYTVVKQISRGADFNPIQAGYFAGMSTQTGINSDWWHILSMDWSGDGSDDWISQLALPTAGNRGIRYRTRQSGSSSSWFTCLDSTNYSSYTPTRSEAIKNITRSGTTFTATRCDGTTFTFTQQDNNTWRACRDNLTSTETAESLSANQGRLLNNKINSTDSSGSFTRNANAISNVVGSVFRTARVIFMNCSICTNGSANVTGQGTLLFTTSFKPLNDTTVIACPLNVNDAPATCTWNTNGQVLLGNGSMGRLIKNEWYSIIGLAVYKSAL